MDLEKTVGEKENWVLSYIGKKGTHLSKEKHDTAIERALPKSQLQTRGIL